MVDAARVSGARLVVLENLYAYGPSAFGDFVVRPALSGKRSLTMGRPDTLHTYYQFDAPFVVDDTTFRSTFGGHVSSWEDIIPATLAAYDEHASPVGSAGR